MRPDVLREVLDLLYPPGLCCGLCGAELDQRHEGLCPRCLPELPAVDDPCPGCGRGTLGGALCRSCTRWGELGDGACVAFDYDGLGRQLLLGFKFRDNTGHAELIGWAMLRALRKAGFDTQADCVVPVPIHWRRRLQRGYNQTELLARELSQHLGKPLVRGVLSRPAYTRPLAASGSGAVGRAENARRSFGPGQGDLSGQTALLVDDIVTTGSTVRACVDILKGMGARRVLVVAAAAVPQRIP